MKKNRQLFAKIILLCAGILVALALFEVFLRFVYPQTLNVYAYDGDYLFGFRPFSQIDYSFTGTSRLVKFNSEGFRDIEHDYFHKPSGTRRIMLLGDSFVAGIEVDVNETFVHRIRQSFPDVEVISAAVNGWSTEQEFLFLKKRGLKYQPDVVALVYYVGNDQIDNVGRALLAYDGKDLVKNKDRPLSQSRLRAVYYSISSTFHAFNFFQTMYWKIREMFNRPYGQDYDNAFVQYLKKSDEPGIVFAWEKTFALLDEMHSVLSSEGIDFVLILVPEQVQSNPVLRKQRSIGENGLVIDKPQILLKEYAASRDIPVLDLLPAFQASANETLHFDTDFHWNAAGHALAAEEIATFLKSRPDLLDNGEQ